MHWISTLLLLGTIGYAHLQCLTEKDDVENAVYSTNLSGMTDFGLRLYKELSPPTSRGNFFFSPYSIWSALALTYLGSEGNTKSQFESAVGLQGIISTLRLLRDLDGYYKETNDPQITLNLANRVYVQNDLGLKNCTRQFLANELQSTNFQNNVAAANEINKLVKDVTKNRITNIVSPRDLVDALMVVVNAAFFKGTWKYQFKTSNTQKKDFFINSQDTAPLAMMSQKGSFRYGESLKLGARVLELPYSGEAVSMFILLPRPDLPFETRFAEMVNNLNSANLLEAIDRRNMPFTDVEVEVPKFKFSMKLGEKLSTAFQSLGLTDIYDPVLADLSGFSSDRDLYLSQAIHKAFIEVNEEGSEAAAATALTFITRSGIPREPKFVKFTCNEPFIFFIFDNRIKNVLFLGSIRNPRG